MNNYILCYCTEKGNKFCKNYFDKYITGIDPKDVEINALGDGQYLISQYGEKI